MSRQIVPAQVIHTCDGCNCVEQNEIKLRLAGMKEDGPYTLDFCDECLVEFEAWLATRKES